FAAMNRSAQKGGAKSLSEEVPFQSPQGSVLFASETKETEKGDSPAEPPQPGGIRLPRSLLILLFCSFAVICLAMGFVFAPWVQEQVHARTQRQTVFASTPAPTPVSATQPIPSIETATLDQLKHLAAQGNAAAENTIGLRYATGDGVKVDEKEAARWF